MAKQLLFYERAVPVSKQRHADLSVDTETGFGFARAVNSVPLLAAEFGAAGDEYGIVFVGEGANAFPHVLLGLRDDENLYVDADGHWTGSYVPAFIRRYPFVFSEDKEKQNFIMCIDEDYAGANTQGRGQRLFDEQGEGTPYLQSMLDFLKQFQQQFQRTRALSAKLAELDLLAPMEAKFNLPGDRRAQLRGFSAVDRDRVKALSGDQLSELAKSDALELIYQHLNSMRHVGRLVERLDRRLG